MREHDFAKYLKKNPGPVFGQLETFSRAVVIPAFDEEDELFPVISSLGNAVFSDQAAIIVVVNHPRGFPAEKSLQIFHRLHELNRSNLFPIYAPDLTGGVGEARKIGMDCFVRHQTAQSIDQCVIFSLDADSSAAPEYFSQTLKTLESHPEAPGVIIKTRHRAAASPDQENAIRKYEQYLERYAQKLKSAGSPYGFVSIGSGFAVRGNAYIKAGGMKIKKAGEDFYFLQELAKQNALCETGDALVFPSPRTSERVPFGTGRAVESLLHGGRLPEIPDQAFDALKTLLDSARSPEGFLYTSTDTVPGDCADFFKAEKFKEVWQKISANTPSDHQARLQAFFRWFDGLKTLRFLHAIQKHLGL